MARQQHYDQPGQHSPPRAHQPPATSQSPSARQSTAPSSRRALTHALELAQVAVRLDAQNDDPSGAIYAYARSVSLLNHVMNSVMRGDDDSVRKRSGRRRSSVSARQDEINRLRAIHDTYAERMRILSQIYGIPIIELTPEEAFNPPEQRHEFGEGAESIGTAMLESASAQSPLAAHNPQTQHAAPRAVSVPRNDPYAVSPTTPTPQQQSAPPPAVPAPVQHHHSHSASRISEVPPPRPPPSGPLPSLPGDMGHPASAAPPPLGPLPHPPSFVEPDTPPSGSGTWDFVTSARARAGTGASIAQAASGLGSLLEEPDTARAPVQPGAQRQQYSYAYADDGSAASSQQQRYSPPLPPVPQQRESMPPRPSTPHSASQMTPRQAEPQRPNSGSSRPRARSGSVRSDAPPLPLVGNPSGGSISQRRGNKPPPLPIMSPTPNTTSSGGAPTSSPSSSDHMSPAGSGNVGLGFTNISAPVVRVASSLPPMPHQPNNAVRTRAVSQPGHRPSMPPPAHSFPVDTTQSQPPVPRPPMTPSMSSTPGSQIIPARKASYPSSMLSTPYGSSPTIAQQGSSVSLALAQQQQLANPCMPISPQPNQVPTDPLLKPYHLMHALRQSMTSKTGAYLTRRLHVPHEVWNVVHLGKLNAVSDKVGVVEKLARVLDEVGTASANFCGFGAPTADPSRDEVERWILKLDEWAAVCEDVVLKDGKKLGVGEGFVARKSGGWGNKFARSFEKMTSNGKNMDSSGNYVAMLSRLFMGAGVLESHTKWFLSTPRGAPYGTLSQDLLQQLDMRLRRSSEFFAKVVLTFVIRDLAQLLDRHAKNGEKWLAQ
ncbi:hypothetical protein EXIGLDRAFT_720883 [Exidia glandulosa HHB12029]|uniref:MIT domain-containing protein n=1 Tax=Exidia glandulosa HHB12029 TaxID=1314781 RepID=A0A165NF29_EXIGL|nr:hypothetical protein EXIGLDRAFT_720883 [Exidia glandulosa HHB12029]